MPNPLFAVDGEWRVWFLNEAGANIIEMPEGIPHEPHTMLDRSLWETFPELVGTNAERELTRALELQVPVSYQHHSERYDAWFAVQAAPLRDGLVVTFHDITAVKRVEVIAERLATEHAALARLADAIARSVPPGQLFDMVAREAAGVLDVEAGAVIRFAGPREMEVVGLYSRSGENLLTAGVVTDDRGMFDQLRATGEPARGRLADERRRDGFRDDMHRMGRLAWLQVPIVVEDRLWGALGLTSVREDAFEHDSAERQRKFAELLSVAIGNADAHDRLARAAATDPVSGLANHRVFHSRLREEAAEASRFGRPLSLALFDLDRFGDVNDLHGHLAGDAILAEVGERLLALSEPGQTLARIGGDEFALIMPGRRPADARAVIERARTAIKREPFGPHGTELTISAGIADLASAGHGELLFACADGALYWSKLNGRDVVCTFEPSIVSELSPTDRAETLLRRKTLAGITALARAIDAKDPSTRQHSERVAQLVEQLARATGWDERRIRMLREAALVHDVGKIGIPDAILLQTGRLTAEQYEVIKRHAPLGAEIVRDVLTPEQVSWVRSHHERPDGRGYPDGLHADEIPGGAAIMSIADALDVMTVGRPYSRPMPLDDAVEECERLVGTQFMPEPAIALRTLHRAGALEEWDIRAGGGGQL